MKIQGSYVFGVTSAYTVDPATGEKTPLAVRVDASTKSAYLTPKPSAFAPNTVINFADAMSSFSGTSTGTLDESGLKWLRRSLNPAYKLYIRPLLYRVVLRKRSLAGQLFKQAKTKRPQIVKIAGQKVRGHV